MARGNRSILIRTALDDPFADMPGVPLDGDLADDVEVEPLAEHELTHHVGDDALTAGRLRHKT